MSAGSQATTRRWGICFTIILALHLGGVWAVLHWRPDEQPAPLPAPAAVMIDLPPAPAVRRAAPRAVAPVPKHEISNPPLRAPVAQPIVPRAHVATVDVPLPPKSQPQAPAHTVPAEPAKAAPDNPSPEPANPAQTEAPPAPSVAVSSPPVAAAPPSNAVPTWQGLLLVRLERFKRYPSTAQIRHQQGVAYLRFAMDRRGKVVSANIERSSGFATLDDETLALIHRAEPLPSPPPEVPGDPVELVVPIQFFLKPGL